MNSRQFLLTAMVAAVAVQLPGTEGAPGEWSAVTPVGPSPPARTEAGMGYDSGTNQLILFGGTSGTSRNDTWIYSVASNTWREVTGGIAPPSRFSMLAGCSNGSFYIGTGEFDRQTFFSDIWEFNIATEKWRQLPNNGYRGDPRYGAAGGILEGANNFYVALGFASERYFDVYHYDITQQAWFLDFDGVHPYGLDYPHARCLMSSTFVSADHFVFHGGCLTGGATGGPCPSSDSWGYEAREGRWTRYPDCASPRNYGSMGRLVGANGETRVIMYGGSEQSGQVLMTRPYPASQIAVLDPNADSNQWSLKTAGGTVPTKRQKQMMASVPNGIYMFGGSTADGITNETWFLEATVSAVDSLPTSEECGGAFLNFIILHGVLMVIGWGVLLQAGAFIARYCKRWNPLWFHLHRICQISGLIISIIGFGLIFPSLIIGGHLSFAHAIIGLVVMILGVLQPLNTIRRPHPTEKDGKKSLKRRIWEIVHRMGGRTALLLAMINITLGLALAQASDTIMVVWFVYFCILGAAYLFTEIGKFAVKKLSNTGSPVNRPSRMDSEEAMSTM